MKNKTLQYNAVINSLKVIILAIFPFITIPYVTKILGIANIGKIQFATTFIEFFLIFANYGIHTYALREGAIFKDEKEKLSTFASEVFSINIITTIISIFILFLLTICISNLHEYSIIIWILSISIVFSVFNFEWVFLLYEKFTYIAFRSIIVQLISVISILVFVHNKNDVLLYVILTSIFNSSSYIINIIGIKKMIGLKITLYNNWKKHFQPMTLFFLNEIIQQIYINSDILMLGLLTNNDYIGYYTIPVKIYFLVKRIINSMIAVIIARLAYYSKKRKKDYVKLLSNTINVILLVVLPLSTILVLLSNDILLFLFGIEFMVSSLSLKILSITLIFAVLANIFCNGILIINNREKDCLIGVFLSSTINIVLNLFLLNILKHNGAAFTTLISELFIMTYSFVKSKKYIKKNNYINNLIKELIGCTGIFIVYCFVQIMILSHFLKIILVSIVGIAVYFIIQLSFKNKSLLAIRELSI